jgi:hypothetical protein
VGAAGTRKESEDTTKEKRERGCEAALTLPRKKGHGIAGAPRTAARRLADTAIP